MGTNTLLRYRIHDKNVPDMYCFAPLGVLIEKATVREP